MADDNLLQGWMPAGVQVVQHPDRDSWLRGRADGVGASEVARLVRRTRYGGPWTVYDDKSGDALTRDSRPKSEPMEAGWYLEPGILAWAVTRLGDRPERLRDLFPDGYRLIPTQLVNVWRTATPWERCSPDALLVVPGRPVFGGVDAKCLNARREHEVDDAGRKVFGEQWTDRVPLDLYVQCQWSCYVTGAAFWLLAVAFGGQKLRIYYVPADGPIMAALAERVETFWRQHVLAGVEPEMDVVSATAIAEALTDRYPRAEPDLLGYVDPFEADLAAAVRLLAVRQAADALDALETHLTNYFLRRLGSAPSMSLPDDSARDGIRHLFTWKNAAAAPAWKKAADAFLERAIAQLADAGVPVDTARAALTADFERCVEASRTTDGPRKIRFAADTVERMRAFLELAGAPHLLDPITTTTPLVDGVSIPSMLLEQNKP